MKKYLLIGLPLLLVAMASLFILKKDVFAPSLVKTPEPKTTQKIPSQQPSFDKTRYSINDPESLWVVVNKKRPLPHGYAPSDFSGVLRKEAKINLDNLVANARTNGVAPKVISGYRSQSAQASLYSSYVVSDGQANADTYSARPRHSEHQTGLAVDLGNSSGKCNLEICFENTAEGEWIKLHAQEYGFIIRYPDKKTTITGYQYEPWHLRYVGVDLAKELHKTSQTMEEFFGLAGAINY